MKRSTFAFCLLPFAFCLAVSSASAIDVILSTTTLRPGDTLRVEINGLSPDQRVRGLWGKKSYPFYTVGPSAHRALIGIELGAEPERFTLQIQDISGGKPPFPAVASAAVEIASRTYETENVNFSSRTLALMAHERRESHLIGAKKKYLSREQLWEGSFLAPVTGPLIGAFGLKRLRNGSIVAGYHKGVDIRAAQGTSILATNSGVILLASALKAHGGTVLINHGQGVMSIYLHMSRIRVRPGQRVKKGDVIGDVGATGLATAPHLHWQVYVHGIPVDPEAWLTHEF